MIRKDKGWVWSINKDNQLEDRLSVGKWITFGSKEFMEDVFPKIDQLVESGKIYQAKYAHRENKDTDPFWQNQPVLCVYADDLTKEQTLQEIRALGIRPSEWKYDSQTRLDWQPGGGLYEKIKKTV